MLLHLQEIKEFYLNSISTRLTGSSSSFRSISRSSSHSSTPLYRRESRYGYQISRDRHTRRRSTSLDKRSRPRKRSSSCRNDACKRFRVNDSSSRSKNCTQRVGPSRIGEPPTPTSVNLLKTDQVVNVSSCASCSRCTFFNVI